MARSRANNPEKHRQYQKQYVRPNPHSEKRKEQLRKSATKWRVAHPEASRASVAKWKAANSIAVRQYRVQYDKKNADRLREKRNQWEAKNAEKRKIVKRQWRKANAERVRATNKRWRAENPDKLRAIRKKGYAKNIEVRLARSRDWQAKNAERSRVAHQQWRDANREKSRASRQRWQDANPEKVADSRIKVYLKRKTSIGATGAYTNREWRILLDETGHRCAACGIPEAEAIYKHAARGKPPLIGKLTPDHIIPLSKGGSGMIVNIAPLCLPCNTRKNNRSIGRRTA